MTQNKYYKHQTMKFLLPAILMLTGAVGMVMSSSAWAPLTEVGSNMGYYDKAYRASASFQYSNAAMNDLSRALDKQLRGWGVWKTVAYATYQATGNVRGVYGSYDDEYTSSNNLAQYKSYGQRNIFDTLVDAVNEQNSGMSVCRGIATKGSYSYDTFSRIVQCVKDNGGAATTSSFYTNYKGLLHDAETVLQLGESKLQNNYFICDHLFWYENCDQIIALSVDELASKLENSIYASVYGNGYDSAMLAELLNLQTAFRGDVDTIRTMTEAERENFAKVYDSAKSINPDFDFDFNNYIARDDNTGDGDTDNDINDEELPVTNPDTNEPSQPSTITNDNIASSNSNSKVVAPNTGTLEKPQSSSTSNAGFVLSAVAIVAGIIGMVLVVRSYLFSPLKRK